MEENHREEGERKRAMFILVMGQELPLVVC